MCLSFRQQHEAIVKHAQNILDTKQVTEQFACHLSCKADVQNSVLIPVDPDSIGSVLRSGKGKMSSRKDKNEETSWSKSFYVKNFALVLQIDIITEIFSSSVFGFLLSYSEVTTLSY
jgi:hypothetical protein